MKRTRVLAPFGVLVAMFAMLLALVCVPQVAYAQSFSVDGVNIDATIGTDGSLSVTEQRTYVFDGTFNGIFWDVPLGSFAGRDVDTTLGMVEVVSNGALTPLEEGYDGAPGTYEVERQSDCIRLKIYWPAADEAVTFQVSYVTHNLASRWADTAELYWKYVPVDTDSDVEWLNITARISMPAPGGVTYTVGEDVRAWGHGPIDSSLSFDGRDVVFFSPGVGTAEFLEARVLFPSEWLSDAPQSGESRLEAILAEEDQWARDANAQRMKARMTIFGIPGAMALASVGSAIATRLYKKGVGKKGPKAVFDDEYFRDVPTNDHPAVLGMLYHDGKITGSEFTATLMNLADQGRIGLDVVWAEKKGKLGSTRRTQQWRLLRRKGTVLERKLSPNGKEIDKAALSFVFNVVGDKHKHTIDPTLLGPAGEPYVLPPFFEETAEGWPQQFENGYEAWSNAVRAAYKARAFEETNGEESMLPGLLGLADFAVAVILGFWGMIAGVPNVFLIPGIIVCFAVGIYCVMSNEDGPIYYLTQEGAEVKARLEALKRWLVDFTRLKEAIPTDVVLWNRLLVMATVMGVADKVVEQLKVTLPQLVSDPRFSAYAWYADDVVRIAGSPVALVDRSLGQGRSTSSAALHHSVSTSSAASSSNSSSSGGGGGFSSGGGGGFSGGGRGGAF